MIRTLTLAATLAVAATSLSAATIQVVYSGTVSGSFDQTDFFGTGGTSLDGMSYTATFVYRTDLGSDHYTSSNVEYITGSGGSAPSPIVSAKLTINGIDFILAGQGSGFEYRISDSGYSFGQTYAYDLVNSGGVYDYRYMFDSTQDAPGVIPLDVTSGYSSTNPSLANGYFTFQRTENNGALTVYNVSGTLNALRVEASAVAPAPVPLPASGLLLFAALGGVASMRRRKAA